MNLFDQLVTEALKNQPKFSDLRMVVEKELLHHDILRVLNHNDLLSDLTFIGGTCLRCCYSGIRLSEDLDFTGGKTFTKKSLSHMAKILIDNLHEKYGLSVKVSEPMKEKKNVDTWKITIETRPGHRHLPTQRINIDICAVPSYEKQPMILLNPYGVEMGTSGLILQAQSREEIYADKLLAFALRPNRIKYRDLWDIIWLHQQGIKPRLELIPKKLEDRNLLLNYFLTLFDARRNELDSPQISEGFAQEMRRFLPAEQIKFVRDKNLWNFLQLLIKDFQEKMQNSLK